MDKTQYAFPQGQQVGDVSISEGGLTLRDYFAAKAMQSYLAHPECEDDYENSIADAAYYMADAMMEAREK